MDKPVESLSNKVTRDLAYPIGGGLILCSIWLAFIADKNIECSINTLSSIPTVLFLVLIGFAYVIGFVCQEAFSLIPCFSTTLKIDGWNFRFRSVMNYLYRLYTKEPFTNMTGFADKDASDIMEIDGFNTIKNKIERAVTLKHIGTCIGPCSIISCIILYFSMLFYSTLCATKIVGCVILLLIGIFLLLMGRLKTMQEIYYFEHLEGKKISSHSRLQ